GSGPAPDAADQPGRDRHRLQPQAHGHTHAAASESAAVGPLREPTPRRDLGAGALSPKTGPPEALLTERWSRPDTESPISYPNATSSRRAQCRDSQRRWCERSPAPATWPHRRSGLSKGRTQLKARPTRGPGARRG